MIYLDNAATTNTTENVRLEMSNIIENYWANPSSSHKLGHDAKREYEIYKINISKLLNTQKENVIFTSGATESINTVLKGFWNAYPRHGRHLITSKTEHPATLEVCKFLEKNNIEITYLPVESNGKISLKFLRDAIKPQTSLISLLLVNNETGTLTDFNEIFSIKNKLNPEIKIHLDGVQALGKIKFDYNKADYVSFSAHKLHGPKGIGAILKKSDAKLFPLIHGGGQEEKYRSGTTNLAGIAGFSKAMSDSFDNIDTNFKRVFEFKNFTKALLIKNIPGLRLNSSDDTSPYILNISIPGIMGEVAVRILESKGIYVSTSSACKSKNKSKSHVLSAMGVDDKYIKGTLRISFSPYNTKDELKYFCENLIMMTKKRNVF